MAIKVKIKTPGLDSLNKKKIANKKFQKKLGARVLKDIMALISVGKSPVRGQGRYKGYKVDRITAEDRKVARGFTKAGRKAARARIKAKSLSSRFYPNSVQKEFPGKQKRPVNLKLSGDMLKAMKFKGITGGVKIGLIGAKRKLKDIFEAHNEGTNTKKKVPRRAILPTGASEKFTASIQRRIKNLYLARIRQLISKAKKRR